MESGKPMPLTPTQRAREQALAYASVFAPTPLELDNDMRTLEIPPHPNLRMLDDDQMEAYDELLFDADTKYDREPDLLIPEQKLQNGLVIPAETKQGALKIPYRIGGEKVKPAYSIRVVQIALGDEAYAKLRAGGKSAGDVWRIWNTQGLEVAAREAQDPKSLGSNGLVASVSGGDSV
jgi:hypothetical protein